MSGTIEQVQLLIASGEVRISEHGYDEMANADLTAREVVAGVETATVVEDYPDFPKGPAVLLLQTGQEWPTDVVWGIPKGHETPTVLVTAYRPDPSRWNPAFTERKR